MTFTPSDTTDYTTATATTTINVMQATPALFNTDSKTQGNWIGTYGSAGLRRHRRRGQPARLRHRHPLRPVEYVWTASPNAPQALENAGGTGAIAACWYSPTSFTVDVDLTDGQAHDLALYFMDWGDNGRGASRCRSATPRRVRC